ncbi:hypothetical protein KKF92_02425 [Patescibacteria group bacterium]|nr:hypothetical protein [Patescibacteria group bacterium]
MFTIPMINPQPTTTGFYTPPSKIEGAKQTGQSRPVGNQIKKAKKITKYILMGLVMLILIGGGIAGYLLSQKPQDVRQQASTKGESPLENQTCSQTFTVLPRGCNDACSNDTQCQDGLKCLPESGTSRHCLHPQYPSNTTSCTEPAPIDCPCPENVVTTTIARSDNSGKFNAQINWTQVEGTPRQNYQVFRCSNATCSQSTVLPKPNDQPITTNTFVDTNDDQGFTCDLGLRYQVKVDDSLVACLPQSCPTSISLAVNTPACVVATPTPTTTPLASCTDSECKITNLSVIPNPQHPDRQLDVTWQIVGTAVTANKNNFQIHYAVKTASNERFSSGSWHVLNGTQFTVGSDSSQVNKVAITQISTDNPLLANTPYLVDVTCKKSTVAPAVYCHDSSQTASTQGTTPESTIAPVPPTATPQPTATATPVPTVIPGNPTYTPVPPTATPAITLTPTPTRAFACDSACETDGNCQTVNAEYICAASYGNKCRLDANRESNTCSARSNTYVCNSHCDTTDECRTANSNYKCSTTYGNVCRLAANEGASNCQPINYVAMASSVAPLAGCNETCQSNANCAYTNYICYSTSSGNVCRLDQYPNSANCQPPAVVNAYVPAPQQVYIPPQQIAYVQQNPAVYSPVIPAVIPTPAPRADYTPYTPPTAEVQPELPAELYQTGPADWANWLKAGLVTLGLGAALLLLL